MLNLEFKRKLHVHFINFICLIITVGLLTSACEPLRKKFTREKKKTEVSEETPLLEPIEYPEKVYTPKEIYARHFSLWKLWHSELISSILDDSLRRRQKYLIGQAITNLEMAKGFLLSDKQQKLEVYFNQLKKIQQQLNAPALMSGGTSIKVDLESLEKKIRKEFNPKAVEGSIKS